MEEFITILDRQSTEIVEKKSKFIANIIHIENIDEAEQVIKEVRKKYHDARHNCIAYRVMNDGQIIEKSSDDGEPSGTAGGQMINILKKNNLCNLVVIVTRYFGGILLGTGGLVRAYSDVTLQVIEKCTKIIKIDGLELIIELDYSNLENFKYYCKCNDIFVKNIDYSENVKIKIEMEKNRKKHFLDDIETKKLNIQCFQLIKESYIDKILDKK